VCCTAAALATERLRIGTGICLVVQRDPILTAKEVASVDLLSGGRLLFGVGAGWNEEEMRNHGTEPHGRFGLMGDRVKAMQAIWTQDEAEYHGRHVDFDPIWSWPKPVQKPHPPILVGGTGPKVFDRVLAYGDEWFPNRSGDPATLGERIAQLQERGREAGRGPFGVTYYGASPDRDTVELMAKAGVTRCVFYVPTAPADEVTAAADEIAALVQTVGPALA
jgi:probable F420-dependent oxidoreductase